MEMVKDSKKAKDIDSLESFDNMIAEINVLKKQGHSSEEANKIYFKRLREEKGYENN